MNYLKIIVSDDSKIHISHKNIWNSVRYSAKYAKSLMNHSDILCDKFEYQSAISLTCLSHE